MKFSTIPIRYTLTTKSYGNTLKNSPKNLGASRVTITLIKGSLIVCTALTLLLVAYDLTRMDTFRLRTLWAAIIICYLSVTLWLARKGNTLIANWLLIALYQLLTGMVMLYWGLESMIGIVTACFAILLPGILMAPRQILGVTVISFFIIVVVYSLQAMKIVTPHIYIAKPIPSLMDVAAYCTILAIFALVSWVSSYQSSISLKRALNAEGRVRKQKDLIALELDKQSAKLRQLQLQEMQQLYKFAIIGQSASMTLHELSNHLSILNLDIDDIKQRYKNSKAIENAQESMEYINSMVRKARAQLGKPSTSSSFDIYLTIKQLLKDLKPKFEHHGVLLKELIPKNIKTLHVHGDASNFMQIVTILINNAIDASYVSENPVITLSLLISDEKVYLTIKDNGPGIPLALKNTLFQPLKSSKPTGLGIGLYVASHLIKTQFKGHIKLLDTNEGAAFELMFRKNNI